MSNVMNRSITLALGMMALLSMTSLNAVAQSPAVDEVKITGAKPPPGTPLERGKPVTIDVGIDYNLASQDKAWLNVSIGEMQATPPNCRASGGVLTDAVGMDIVRGRHQIKMSLVWSGDTGAKSKGRIYGTGYIAFFPSFLAASHGKLLKYFGMAPGYCYPFGGKYVIE